MLLVSLKHYLSVVWHTYLSSYTCVHFIARAFYGGLTQPMGSTSSRGRHKAVCFLSHCGLCPSSNGGTHGILCWCLFLGRVQVSQSNLRGLCPDMNSDATFSCIFCRSVPGPISTERLGLFQTFLALHVNSRNSGVLEHCFLSSDFHPFC